MKSVALVTDAHTLTAILGLVTSATQRIDMIAFSFSIPVRLSKGVNGPLRIVEALLEAVERGVVVRLYIEGERETAARNTATVRLLEERGVEVVFGTCHAKGFCVDGERVLIGSTNLTNQSLTLNIETNLLFDDVEVSAGFERYFEHLWKGGRHGGVTLPEPWIADGAFAPVLIDLIDRATERLDFSIYFFDYAPVREALIRAHRGGVHVRGLVHTHKSFALPYVRRTEATVRRLVDAGITDLHTGPPQIFTHAKVIVRDQREVLVGTGNWLLEDVEEHPQLHVLLDDADLGARVAAHLDQTIEARGTPVAA